MISVGAVAFALNIFVLIVLGITERVIGYIIFNFSTSRLLDRKETPIPRESDTWISSLPLSLVKYRKNPAILCSIILLCLLVVSELFSEFGVSTSATCSPQRRAGPVLNPGDLHNTNEILLIIACTSIEAVEFANGNLTGLKSGLPKEVTPETCISCTPSRHPDLMRGCSVNPWKIYQAGELDVAFSRSSPVYNTITNWFREVDGDRIKYRGRGDVIITNDHFFISFLFSFSEGDKIHYFEYSEQDHVKTLWKQSNTKSPGIVWEQTKGAVEAYNISCEKNTVSAKQTAFVSQVFRTVQLENHVKPLSSPKSSKRMEKQFTSDSLYRAVWAGKLLEGNDRNDTYFEYRSCGEYKWAFAIPLLVSVALLPILLISSWAAQKSSFKRRGVPRDPCYRHLRGQIMQPNGYGSAKSGIFSNIVLDDDFNIYFYERDKEGGTMESGEMLEPGEQPRATIIQI